jgi:hypothetical protein
MYPGSSRLISNAHTSVPLTHQSQARLRAQLSAHERCDNSTDFHISAGDSSLDAHVIHISRIHVSAAQSAGEDGEELPFTGMEYTLPPTATGRVRRVSWCSVLTTAVDVHRLSRSFWTKA